MLVAIAVASGLLAAPGVVVSGRPDPEAGKAQAKLVCQACHGMDGISLVRNYPNLRGQKELYVVKQLEAFRSGERNSPEMNVMAMPLSDQQIRDLAAYYSQMR